MSAHNSILSHPKYRPDIDGLRAIAVLFVVAFHAFPGIFKGGFIGVDVFFVISGYLISTIIIENLKKDSFSFIEFYSRRIRRIFPALLIVFFFSALLGWFTLFADEYKQLGKHIAGGAAFISNFILWGESGYFDDVSETKPLMHLWSLGIEEQFYILFPFLLWLGWKSRRNFLMVILSISIVSFMWNVVRVSADPVGTFYFPQTRFWELMIGTFLAYLVNFQKLSTQFVEARAFLGLILLGIGFFTISRESLFPGGWALLPTLGAAFLISAGPSAWINAHLLSNRFMVWVGLISFPLYLWHWVLLSFARVLEGDVPSRSTRVSLVLTSFLFSWITVRFVERPFRFGSLGSLKVAILSFFMMGALSFGYWVDRHKGIKDRRILTDVYLRQGEIGNHLFYDYYERHFKPCDDKNLFEQSVEFEGMHRCFQSALNRPVEVALVGDSHAEHIYAGLAEAYSNKNIAYFTQGGYPYLKNSGFQDIFKYIINNEDIKTVILGASWSVTQDNIQKDIKSHKEEVVRTVKAFLAANKKVLLLEDVPHFSFDPRKCKRHGFCTEARSSLKIQLSLYEPIFREVAEENKGVYYIPVADYFCDNSQCYMKQGEDLLYRDYNHLNILGSQYLGRRLFRDHPDLMNAGEFL